VLVPFFRFVFDEKKREELKNLTKHFLKVAEEPAFVNHNGKVYLCK